MHNRAALAVLSGTAFMDIDEPSPKEPGLIRTLKEMYRYGECDRSWISFVPQYGDITDPLLVSPRTTLQKMRAQLDAVPHPAPYVGYVEDTCMRLVEAGAAALDAQYLHHHDHISPDDWAADWNTPHAELKLTFGKIGKIRKTAGLPPSARIQCYNLAASKVATVKHLHKVTEALKQHEAEPQFLVNCFIMHACMTQRPSELFHELENYGDEVAQQEGLGDCNLPVDVRDFYRYRMMPVVVKAADKLADLNCS